MVVNWKELLIKMSRAKASDRAVAKTIARLATEYGLNAKELARFYRNIK